MCSDNLCVTDKELGNRRVPLSALEDCTASSEWHQPSELALDGSSIQVYDLLAVQVCVVIRICPQLISSTIISQLLRFFSWSCPLILAFQYLDCRVSVLECVLPALLRAAQRSRPAE